MQRILSRTCSCTTLCTITSSCCTLRLLSMLGIGIRKTQPASSTQEELISERLQTILLTSLEYAYYAGFLPLRFLQVRIRNSLQLLCISALSLGKRVYVKGLTKSTAQLSLFRYCSMLDPYCLCVLQFLCSSLLTASLYELRGALSWRIDSRTVEFCVTSRGERPGGRQRVETPTNIPKRRRCYVPRTDFPC